MTAIEIRNSLARFTATIRAVAPGALAHGNADGTVGIDFADGTTQQQQADANSIAATFDWSAEAQAAYLKSAEVRQLPARGEARLL